MHILNTLLEAADKCMEPTGLERSCAYTITKELCGRMQLLTPPAFATVDQGWLGVADPRRARGQPLRSRRRPKATPRRLW